MSEPIIRVEHVSKSFPGVKALSDVSLAFEKGKVNVLLGENGAGKSTLIKLLAGIYTHDEGDLYYGGEKTQWKSASEALERGISVIHQELSIIEDLSVAENIFLGREAKSGWLIDKKTMLEDSRVLLKRLNLDINPQTLAKELSAAEKQMVEIARALSHKSDVVIMDEPTSSLTINETETLFRVIEELKSKGVCIIYISHRMSEIKRIGDTVSILKDGCLVGTVSAIDTDEKDWIRMMVGRDIRRLDAMMNRQVSQEVVLSVKNITNGAYCKNVSFELHKGEILGISGLVGAGRTELLRAVFGADKRQSGTIAIGGKPVSIRTTSDAISHGIALVPEDRRAQGLLLEKNIIDNVALPNLFAWRKNKLVDKHKEKTMSQTFIDKLMIKVSSLKSPTKYMSGGNQQKVVLSKWLAANSAILFMDEPTRGIDVNAKNEIYALMFDFVEKGGSIVMVSSELPEILSVSDRVMVMREGECVAFFDKEDANEKAIISVASLN